MDEPLLPKELPWNSSDDELNNNKIKSPTARASARPLPEGARSVLAMIFVLSLYQIAFNTWLIHYDKSDFGNIGASLVDDLNVHVRNDFELLPILNKEDWSLLVALGLVLMILAIIMGLRAWWKRNLLILAEHKAALEELDGTNTHPRHMEQASKNFG
jgi:hypothetical protein